MKDKTATDIRPGLAIGLSTGLFGARGPVEDDFHQLRAAQIHQVEVRIKPGYIDVDDRAMVLQLEKWASHYQVDIQSVHGPSGFPGISPISALSGERDWLAHPDETVRQLAVKRRCDTLEIARFLGAKHIIVEYECYDHAPYWPHGSQPTAVYQQSGERWRQSVAEILETAEKTGIRLAIENIDGLSCSEQAEFVHVCQSGCIGLCFDSSHASYEPDNFFQNLDLFLPDLIATHLSDNDSLTGCCWRDRHWTPFWGVLNWEQIVRSIVESSYSGCLMLEVLNKEKSMTDELLCAIEKLKQLISRYERKSQTLQP